MHCVKRGKTDVKNFSGSNKIKSINLLKFSVFIACLMTKAINSFTLGIRKFKKNKRRALSFAGR